MQEDQQNTEKSTNQLADDLKFLDEIGQAFHKVNVEFVEFMKAMREVKKEKKQDLLKYAMEALDDYLNAGHKDARRAASVKAKQVYEAYYGVPYMNREDRLKMTRPVPEKEVYAIPDVCGSCGGYSSGGITCGNCRHNY